MLRYSNMKPNTLFTIVISVLIIHFAVGIPVISKVNSNVISEVKDSHKNQVTPESAVIPSKNNTALAEPVFRGVCDHRRHPLIYTENFILENDKKSQVLASMLITLSDPFHITCVEVATRDQGRPRVLSGGDGGNSTEVGVDLPYGVGFDFTVKLYGYSG